MRQITKFLALALAGSAVLGCSSEQDATSLKSSGFDPKPERGEVLDVVKVAKRFRGQTEFSNVKYSYNLRHRAMAESASTNDAAAGGAQREVQESDVFKVGAEGSKLLYLLNNQRGLQVVSFANGVRAPEIVGRVPATGNYSERMYYLEDADRIVVLENNHTDENGSYKYSRNQSRIVVYNVEDSTSPELERVIDLEGQVADSRVVGEVLYIASSIRPNYYDRQNAQKPKGLVYSIRFGEEGVERNSLQKVDLALPSSARENMNIVEVKEGDGYKYYLLSVLSESGWGWWDAKSLVEVVDITDPKGAIKPLMVVSAKGNIRERSQAFIKDGQLVVVSNYQVDRAITGTNRRIARIAVENFALPTAEVQTIDSKEADYRKLHIDRQLKGLTGDEKDEMHQKLISDSELGLKKVFVKTDDGKVRKIVADHVVTVGDTNGLSANLQDVRVSGDQLYVFWVPANNIDPLDLFDLSDLENGVKYIKRLQFDGWISRAEPLNYKGRQFVLGLGWINPNVNNERWRRQPQAMLFEIINHNNQPRALDIAQFTLSMENGWANFNRGDKYVDFRLGADGKGSVLFQITGKVEDKWRNGGKIINVDIEAALEGRESDVFTESGFLATDNSSWLKRIFRNSEIEKINTFSDSQLATFEDDNRSGNPDKIYESISVLELARDIKAFVNLSTDDMGVQVVGTGSSYSYYGSTPAKTELRLIDASNADAEQSDVIQTLTIDGSFSSKIKTGPRSFLISTWNRIPTRTTGSNGLERVSYKSENLIYSISFKDSKLSVVAKDAMEVTSMPQMGGFRYYNPYRYNQGIQFSKSKEGYTLANYASQLYVVNANSTPMLEELKYTSCLPENEYTSNVLNISGNFLLHAQKTEMPKDKPSLGGNISFTRNYFAPLSIDWNTRTVTCGTLINIPGTPVSLKVNRLITRDSRLVELIKNESTYTDRDGNEQVRVNYNIKQESLLSSTLIDFGKKATLVDIMDASEVGSGKLETLNNGQIIYTKVEKGQNNYGIGIGFDSMISRHYYPRQTQSQSLGFLSVDEDGFFITRQTSLRGEMTGAFSLHSVLDTKQRFGEVVITSVGKRLFFLKIGANGSMEKLALTSETANGEISESGDSVLLPGWVSTYNPLEMDFDTKTNRLVISQGMAGATAVTLTR